MSAFTFLRRRHGSRYRYSLTFADASNVALLEIDTREHGKREPTRTLAIATTDHISELEETADRWNGENQSKNPTI